MSRFTARIRIKRVTVSPRAIACAGCGHKTNGLSLYRDFILPGRYHRRCLPATYQPASTTDRVDRPAN